MKHTSTLLSGLALAFLLSATQVRADTISFGYDWSQSTSFVDAAGAHSGSVLLAEPFNGTATTPDTVTAAVLTTNTSATAGNPDKFTGQSYTMILSLTDLGTGQKGVVRFAGQFFGSLSVDSASITTTYDSTPHKLTLGDHVYTVTLTDYLAPGPPQSLTSGFLKARVEAATAGNHPPHQAPEPSALTLIVLGLAAFATPKRVAAGRTRPAPE